MIVGYLLVHKELDEQYYYRVSRDTQTEQDAVVSAYGYFRSKYGRELPNMYPTSFDINKIKVKLIHD